MASLDIIICPGSASLVSQELWKSLRTCRGELEALGCRAVLSGDPERDLLPDAFSSTEFPLAGTPSFALPPESSPVATINAALRHALSRGRGALLLVSEAALFPGAVAEMSRVATEDEMIGFVSPRSNHGGLCGLPTGPEGAPRTPEEAHAAFEALSARLPAFSYLPAGDPARLLIRRDVLSEFGLLDETYETQDAAVRDLVQRANRGGYRAVAANRAFVYYAGFHPQARTSPDAGAMERDSERFHARHPENRTVLDRYSRSACAEAERVLTGLSPDRDGRLDILFDFSNFRTFHCGTFELAKKILAAGLPQWSGKFHVHVLISEEAERFHGLDRFPSLRTISAWPNRAFAAAVHLAQPVRRETLIRMSRAAPVNVYAMLDPIALDCQYIGAGAPDDLHDLWGFVLQRADGVIYISEFVARQFALRLRRRPGLKELVAYPSLNPAEYAPGGASPGGRYLLVAGNNFEHKRMRPTVAALADALPVQQIVALGLADFSARNVTCYPSGGLSDQQIEDLYRQASAVIYPSLYEGFGIPVLKALGYRKPVYARAIGAIREICEQTPHSQNVHLYSSTAELADRLKSSPPVWRVAPEGSAPVAPYGWDDMAARIGTFIEEMIGGLSLNETLLPRLEACRLWETAAPRPEPEPARRTGPEGEEAPRPEDAAEPPPAAATGTAPAVAPSAPPPESDLAAAPPQSPREDALSAALADRDRQLAEIRASWSWKLTAPVRAVGGWFVKLREPG